MNLFTLFAVIEIIQAKLLKIVCLEYITKKAIHFDKMDCFFCLNTSHLFMPNTQNISSFFATNYPLNREGIEEVIAAFEVKIIPQNTILLQEGAQENTLRFLNKGTIREFYVGGEKEININFFTSPQFITDFSSFIHDSKTKKNQESLSELEVLVLGKEKFNNFSKKHSCGRSFIEAAFLKILKHQELLEYNRITKPPEELYKTLQIHKADWLQKIPQYHIASYLGITPETLSRIRKRIS